MKIIATAAVSLTLLILADARIAVAQVSEVNLDRGPASELYLRKRPPVPEAPILDPALKLLLASTETKRDNARIEAIALLREYLDGHPEGDAQADGLFKLAELLWEEARRDYLVRMGGFERDLERCKQAPDRCATEPAEPRIDLKESEQLYTQILDRHPSFRRSDLVLYLVGFAAKEDGREEFPQVQFSGRFGGFPSRGPVYRDLILTGAPPRGMTFWSCLVG